MSAEHSEEQLVLAQLTDPNWSVLEIGPGGHPTPWQGAYESIDLTAPGNPGQYGSEEGMICQATQQGDMTMLPFKLSSFDVVIARHVLEHTADTIGVLEDWRDVLKPNGLLVLICPDQETCAYNTVMLDPTHEACFTRKQLAVLVDRAGFWNVETQTALPAWSFMVTARASK